MLILRIIRASILRLVLAVIAYILIVLGVTAIVPPPSAVAVDSPARSAVGVRFLADTSWLDEKGDRQLQQQIFDDVFMLINEAQTYLLLDMFLFNDWQGPVGEYHRPLSSELTTALIARKQSMPELQIVFITDPVNSIYRGLDSPHLNALRDANIAVVETDLTQLQDSNAFYSGMWRVFVKPFGNARANTMKNPIGDGRVSLRSVLAMANFKANHRKLIVADRADGDTRAIVMSANPHDGSSAHRNVAISFEGDAAIDLLRSELTLMSLSAEHNSQQQVEEQIVQIESVLPVAAAIPLSSGDASIQVLTESLIRDQVIKAYDDAGEGDQIDLLMFYLSDRGIVEAMKRAHHRGARLRVMLDAAKDAFGREKNGVPNRPVAAELHALGIPIKWCATKGEQCHAKMLMWTTKQNQIGLMLGSGNYTRRNLQDFNLETNMLLRAPADHQAIVDARAYFEEQWHDDTPGKTYSLPYSEFADDSWQLTLEYRIRETTGFGTF